MVPLATPEYIKNWVRKGKIFRVCLNFVLRDKNDEFFGLMKHIFKVIAKAIAAKIAKINT